MKLSTKTCSTQSKRNSPKISIASQFEKRRPAALLMGKIVNFAQHQREARASDQAGAVIVAEELDRVIGQSDRVEIRHRKEACDASTDDVIVADWSSRLRSADDSSFFPKRATSRFVRSGSKNKHGSSKRSVSPVAGSMTSSWDRSPTSANLQNANSAASVGSHDAIARVPRSGHRQSGGRKSTPARLWRLALRRSTDGLCRPMVRPGTDPSSLSYRWPPTPRALIGFDEFPAGYRIIGSIWHAMQRLVTRPTLRHVDHVGIEPVCPLSNRVSAPQSTENEFLGEQTVGQNGRRRLRLWRLCGALLTRGRR